MKKRAKKLNNGYLTLESMSLATYYNNWTLNFFRKYLKGVILEIGCGIGNFTPKLLNFGEVYSIDIVKEYIKKNGEKYGNKAKIGIGNIEQGKYFFKNKKFDSIVCINVLEHIKNDKKALENMHSLLNPYGYLILLVPSHQFLYGKIDKEINHYRRYEKSELVKRLMDLKLKIIFKKRINFLGAIGWFLSGKVFNDSIVSDKKLQIFDMVAPFILPIEEKIEPPIGTSIIIVAQKI